MIDQLLSVLKIVVALTAAVSLAVGILAIGIFAWQPSFTTVAIAAFWGAFCACAIYAEREIERARNNVDR